MLDIELPRTSKCINNRGDLAKELHINSLMKKNKESEDSFRTMLEVIVQFMMMKTWQQKLHTTKHNCKEKIATRESNEEEIKTLENKGRNDTRSEIKETNSKHAIANMEYQTHFEENRTSFDESDKEGLFGVKNKYTPGSHVELEPERYKDLSSIRDRTSFQDKNIPRTYPGMEKSTKGPSSVSPLKKGSRRSNISGNVMSTGLSKTRGRSHEEGFRRKQNDLIEDQSLMKIKTDHDESSEIKKAPRVDHSSVPDWKKEILQKKETRNSPPLLQSASSTKNSGEDELIFEDIDDDLDKDFDRLRFNPSRKSTMFQCQPLALKQAKELDMVIFGSAVSSFNTEWRNQGFSFCHLDHLKYGIIQHKGGPCGLLASVQAVILKNLLFNDRLSANKPRLHFSSQETNDALISSLVEILWRAGNYETARVAVRSERDPFIASAGNRFSQKLVIFQTHDRNELEMFIKENIKQFCSHDGGCILLLYSVILTRTVEMIREDMDDDNGTLMGAHGYCTQDMVNLLLTGKAISNTFDDIIELDSGGKTTNILKGIDKQSDIGFLSLFEHYKSCLVGSNLKSPKYPIWVVCSESHFSVLFSMKRSLGNERRSQKKFDLFYYDGLAGQTEEIRLTVDISNESLIEDTTDDLTPPLEHCIRTKWKNALIEWNGTEPLL